jgi:hypothetical protein
VHKIRNFHVGHSTVGEWQGSGRFVAGERHGMCESAFGVSCDVPPAHIAFSFTWPRHRAERRKRLTSRTRTAP